MSHSAFSPLEGFMNKADYDSVVKDMRTTVSTAPQPSSALISCRHQP
jgi:ATP sulfurylase